MVNEMIDDIMTVTTSVPLDLGDGYDLVDMNIENAMIGPAIRQGVITWQQGYVTLHYKLSQIIDVNQ